MLDLPTEFGENLPIFKMCCREYKHPSENYFFEDLLNDVGHAFPFTGKANIKRDRLFRFFLERAEKAAQKRIILFIDDAQRLHEIQYNWLMDIYNELDNVGVSMTVLVGQEDLIHQRSSFIQARKAQIIGRFMIHEYKFAGIMFLSFKDICSCRLSSDSNIVSMNS